MGEFRDIVSDGWKQLGEGFSMLAKGDLNGIKPIFDSLGAVAFMLLVTGPLWLMAWLIVTR